MFVNDPNDHQFTGVLSDDTLEMIKVDMDSSYLMNSFEMINLNRNAEISIYPPILDIYPSLVNITNVPMNEYMQKALTSMDLWIAVITLQENMKQPAGIIGVTKCTDGKPVNISPIYTAKSFRGIGLATRMLLFVRNEIIPSMYPQSKYWAASVIEGNVPSSKLFNKVGMSPIMTNLIGKL